MNNSLTFGEAEAPRVDSRTEIGTLSDAVSQVAVSPGFGKEADGWANLKPASFSPALQYKSFQGLPGIMLVLPRKLSPRIM